MGELLGVGFCCVCGVSVGCCECYCLNVTIVSLLSVSHAYTLRRAKKRLHRDPNLYCVVGVSLAEDHAVVSSVDSVCDVLSVEGWCTDSAPPGGGMLSSPLFEVTVWTSEGVDCSAFPVVVVETMSEVNLGMTEYGCPDGHCVVGANCALPGA